MPRTLDENGREIHSNRPPITATHKRCCWCGRMMPREEFYRHANNTSGLSSMCKPCNRARRQERDGEVLQTLIDRMGGSCADCPERDVIVLGVYPTTDRGRRKKFSSGTTDRKDATMARMLLADARGRSDFAVLCSNCNLRRRHKEGRYSGRR